MDNIRFNINISWNHQPATITFCGTIPNSQAWPGRQETWPGMTSFQSKVHAKPQPGGRVWKWWILPVVANGQKVDEPSSLEAPYFQTNP